MAINRKNVRQLKKKRVRGRARTQSRSPGALTRRPSRSKKKPGGGGY